MPFMLLHSRVTISHGDNASHTHNKGSCSEQFTTGYSSFVGRKVGHM